MYIEIHIFSVVLIYALGIWIGHMRKRQKKMGLMTIAKYQERFEPGSVPTEKTIRK